MSKENEEYDYQSAFSYYGNFQNFFGLMGGFAFTGIVLILSIGDPSAFLSQVVLFMLFIGMNICMCAVMETLFAMGKLSLDSQKRPRYPAYPSRVRLICNYGTAVISLFMFSMPIMFLLKNLVPLFVLTLILEIIIGFYYPNYRWKPVQKELESAGFY